MIPLYWARRLTRLESAMVCVICAVIIAAFLERTFSYMEIAERTAMDVTVQHVNAALQVRRAADLLARGSPNTERNPFALARVGVANVHPDVADAGELEGLERGYWVFERSSGELVYLPQYHRRLESLDGTVRFRLERSPGASYVLVPAAKYSWK